MTGNKYLPPKESPGPDGFPVEISRQEVMPALHNLPKEQHQATTNQVRRGNSPNSFPGAGIAAKDITWKENWVSIPMKREGKKQMKSRMLLDDLSLIPRTRVKVQGET